MKPGHQAQAMGLVKGGGEFARGRLPLLVAAIGLACGINGLPLYTFGLFIQPLNEAFGWTRTQLSVWPMLFMLCVVISGPVAGQLVDRFGVRRVSALSFFLLALAWTAAGLSNGVLMAFYASAVAVAVLGCGTLSGPLTKVVAGWFVRNRGLALGLALCGVLVGVTLTTQTIPRAITAFGWPAGYAVLALMALFAAPVVLFGLKERSETSSDTALVHDGATLREALRQPVFWMLGTAFCVFFIASTGVIVHLVPHLRTHGVTPVEAAGYVAVMSASGAVARIVVGWLADRWPAPYLMVAIYLLSAAAYLALLYGAPGWAMFLAAAAIGFAVGTENDLIAYLSAAYFGLRHYGAVSGALYSMYAFGAASGSMLAALFFDAQGSYRMFYQLAVGCALFGAGLFVVVGRIPYRQLPAAATP